MNKVNIPKFLDQYIHDNKGESVVDIFTEEWLCGGGGFFDQVAKWLYDNDQEENDKRYLLAVQAFVTGEYEVEKEKLYWMPVPYLSFPLHYCVGEDGKISCRQGNPQNFTQEELDKYFPEIKHFAVSVNSDET